MQNPIDKIRKLFAMAKDASSPNEAAIAARQARALMDKFQISEIDLTTTTSDDFGEVHESFGKTMIGWVGSLALHVARINDTRVVWSQHPDTGQRTVRFSGFLTDAVCSAEMMKYLHKTAMRLGAAVPGNRAEKNAYRAGFAKGVGEQVSEILREREQIKTSTGTALVVVKSQLVSQRFGVQKSRRSSRSGSGSAHSYSKGVEAGRSVNLNRQVGSSAGASRYLQG